MRCGESPLPLGGESSGDCGSRREGRPRARARRDHTPPKRGVLAGLKSPRQSPVANARPLAGQRTSAGRAFPPWLMAS